MFATIDYMYNCTCAYNKPPKVGKMDTQATEEMTQGIKKVKLAPYMEKDKKSTQDALVEDMQTGEPPPSSCTVNTDQTATSPEEEISTESASQPNPEPEAPASTASTSMEQDETPAATQTGGKKRTILDDMDEEELEFMMMRGPHMPAALRRELKEYGVPEKLVKHMMYMGSPDMIRDLTRSQDRENRPTPLAPAPPVIFHRPAPKIVRPTWNEPIGRGYTREDMAWSSPEPGEIAQTVRLDDRQVQNNQGGFVYKVDDMGQVRRLLCLGTESGTFYQNRKELTKVNVDAVDRLLEAKRGTDLVAELVKFAGGRVAKMNSLLFVLAKCAKQNKDLTTKRDAYKCLSKVCTIPTHLFIFMEYYSKLPTNTAERVGTGWGRAHRFGIANWYLNFRDNPFKLAMHVTKYRQRNGWTHRDVMRLAHPKPSSSRGSPALACIVKYVVKGLDAAKETYLTEDVDEKIKKILEYLEATEDAKKLTPADAEKACELIKRHRLVREHLPTELLNSVLVWHALLQNMPMTALIRNLGKMTKLEMLSEGSDDAKLVIKKLQDLEQIKGAKLHPYNVFLAYNQYKTGHGDKGSLSWRANPAITSAIEEAFYLSFKAVEPTNKRYCIALDISSSMDGSYIMGSRICARDAAAAMAMVTVRTEKRHNVIGFHGDMVPLEITPTMTLEAVNEECRRHGFGYTDCAKPMTWALDNRKLFDVFIVYTDSETYAGRIHPREAMRRYRDASGIADAKLIVVGMTSNEFSLADPTDPNMLDVIGFDSEAPEIMRNFVLGEI